MQIGICGSPATLAQVADSDQIAFIEGHVQEFLMPEGPESLYVAHATALRNCGRPMPALNCFLPPDLKVVGPAVDDEGLDRYAVETFRRASAIEASLIVFGSGAARMAPSGFSAARGFDQYVNALRRFGPVAASHGITILVEPLQRGECNVVNTILEGAEAVRQADTPGVKLLVDIFHMLRNEEKPEDIEKVAEWIRHVHVAENRDRAAPGTYGEDFTPFFRVLRKIGYNGRLTLEPVWTDLPHQVGKAVVTLQHQLRDAGY